MGKLTSCKNESKKIAIYLLTPFSLDKNKYSEIIHTWNYSFLSAGDYILLLIF